MTLWSVWQFKLATSSRVAPDQLRMGPGMQVGSWFIPVVNLWMPLQNLTDLWHAIAVPATPRESRHTPRLLVGWWVTVVVAVAAYLLGGAFFPLSRVGEAVIAGSVMPVAVPAAVGIAVVEAMTRRALAAPTGAAQSLAAASS